jgi:uncharacterized membrane protein
MGFMTVSGEEVRAAQMISGATMASFMLIGFVPGLKPHAGRIRVVIAVSYLIAVAAFMIYLLVR